jgi:hypothetical protein
VSRYINLRVTLLKIEERFREPERFRFIEFQFGSFEQYGREFMKPEYCALKNA